MEFLLLSAEFPHSVRFSVDRLHAAIEAAIPRRQAAAPLLL